MSVAQRCVRIDGLTDLPRVRPGDDLAALLVEAFVAQGLNLVEGAVLVVAQKIVSKAEGRFVDLATVEPGPRALQLAAETGKDPRLVEVVLGESEEVLRTRENLLIVVNRLGIVMANAGVDRSNVDPDLGAEPVLLLPKDPDASAAALRQRLEVATGVAPGVIICDSVGRAWRKGTVGLAIGTAGIPTLIDLRRRPDLFGRALEVSEIGFADSVAAAACLVMGEANESTPAVLVNGLIADGPVRPTSALIRPRSEDLFR